MYPCHISTAYFWNILAVILYQEIKPSAHIFYIIKLQSGVKEALLPPCPYCVQQQFWVPKVKKKTYFAISVPERVQKSPQQLLYIDLRMWNRLCGQELGHHNVRALIGCLVAMAVKPIRWWSVTARQWASNMSTDAGTDLFFSLYRQKGDVFCAAKGYIAHVPIFCEVTSFSGQRRGESLGAPVMWFCFNPPFPGDFLWGSDWLKIWPHHIPAPWTGQLQTCLHPQSWWEKCLIHCWVAAGAHLRAWGR